MSTEPITDNWTLEMWKRHAEVLSTRDVEQQLEIGTLRRRAEEAERERDNAQERAEHIRHAFEKASAHEEHMQAELAALRRQVTDLTAERDAAQAEAERLRQRTHDLQEHYSHEISQMRKGFQHWQGLIDRADTLLQEAGIEYQSAHVRATVAQLLKERDAARAALAEEQAFQKRRDERQLHMIAQANEAAQEYQDDRDDAVAALAAAQERERRLRDTLRSLCLSEHQHIARNMADVDLDPNCGCRGCYTWRQVSAGFAALATPEEGKG